MIPIIINILRHKIIAAAYAEHQHIDGLRVGGQRAAVGEGNGQSYLTLAVAAERHIDAVAFFADYSAVGNVPFVGRAVDFACRKLQGVGGGHLRMADGEVGRGFFVLIDSIVRPCSAQSSGIDGLHCYVVSAFSHCRRVEKVVEVAPHIALLQCAPPAVGKRVGGKNVGLSGSRTDAQLVGEVAGRSLGIASLLPRYAQLAGSIVVVGHRSRHLLRRGVLAVAEIQDFSYFVSTGIKIFHKTVVVHIPGNVSIGIAA